MTIFFKDSDYKLYAGAYHLTEMTEYILLLFQNLTEMTGEILKID